MAPQRKKERYYFAFKRLVLEDARRHGLTFAVNTHHVKKETVRTWVKNRTHILCESAKNPYRRRAHRQPRKGAIAQLLQWVSTCDIQLRAMAAQARNIYTFGRGYLGLGPIQRGL